MKRYIYCTQNIFLTKSEPGIQTLELKKNTKKPSLHTIFKTKLTNRMQNLAHKHIHIYIGILKNIISQVKPCTLRIWKGTMIKPLWSIEQHQTLFFTVSKSLCLVTIIETILLQQSTLRSWLHCLGVGTVLQTIWSNCCTPGSV